MSGYRILIIDDSEDIHNVLGAYLKFSGFEVLHAGNGAEGLEILNRERPDLVLLDIQMPILDGFGVLEQIKGRRNLASIPVIFLSSLDRPNLKVKGLHMGADDYVVKPFDQAELMARVTVALRRGEHFRQLERTFGGLLGPVSVEELLQTMDLGGKDGRILLPEMEASIEVCQRHVVRSRWAGFEGVDALHRLLLLQRGRFEVDFDSQIEPNEDAVGKIPDVLLSTLVLLDELKEILGESCCLEFMVEGPEKDSEPQFSSFGHRVWPATVAEVIARMRGDLKENARTLCSAINDGDLVMKGS